MGFIVKKFSRIQEKLKWTDDMVRVIAKNYKTKTSEEIAVIINSLFNTDKSAESVRHKGNKHGFPMKGAA